MRGPGRPKEQAPSGYATIRETAARLGVTATAIRGRIERGTIPDVKEGLKPNGETRLYIPEWWIAEEVAKKTGTINSLRSADAPQADMTVITDRLDAITTRQDNL